MVKISRWRKLSLIFVYIYAVSLACKLNALTLGSLKWYGTFQHNVQNKSKLKKKLKNEIRNLFSTTKKSATTQSYQIYFFLNGRLDHIIKVKRNNCVVLIYTFPVKKGKLFLHSWLTRGTLKNWQNYGKVKPMLPMVKARMERERHRALCQASWRKNILTTAYCVTKQLPECRKRWCRYQAYHARQSSWHVRTEATRHELSSFKKSIIWRSKFAFDRNFLMKERLVVRLAYWMFFFSKRKRKNKGR